MASKVAADLYFDIKTDIKGLKKGLADAKREIKNSTKSINATQKKAYADMGNTVVRYIRRIESLVVAIYGIKKAYDLTLGRGHEFNKMMEAEKIGLSLMLVQKLKDVDVTGQQVSAMDKWAYANKLAAQEMEKVRAINVETPHTLGQTIQLYKVVRGQILALGGSSEQALEATKNLSLTAGAANVEFSGLLKTVDQLFAGKMKPSDMQLALQNVLDLRQEDIRAAGEQGKALDFVIGKLKAAQIAAKATEASWSGITSNLTNAWDDLWATMQKPIFDDLKKDFSYFAEVLKESKGAVMEFTNNVTEMAGTIAVPLLKVMGTLTVLEKAFAALSSSGGALVPLLRTLGGIPALIAGIVLAYKNWNDETYGVMEGLKDLVNYFALGVDTIQTVFFGLVKLIGEGINTMGKWWHDFVNSFTDKWGTMVHNLKLTWAGFVNTIAGAANLIPGINEIKLIDVDKLKTDFAQAKDVYEPLVNLDWTNSKFASSYDNMMQSFNRTTAKRVKLEGQMAGSVGKSAIGFKKMAKEIDEVGKKTTKAGGAAKKAGKDFKDMIGSLAKSKDMGNILDLFGITDMEAETKRIQDMWDDVADSIADSMDRAFDGVMSGDIQGVFRSMFTDMVRYATQGAAKIAVEMMATGQVSALAAIARGGAEGGWYGMAAMAAAMAALGLFAGSIGGGGISDQQMKAAQGVTGVQSEGVARSLDMLVDQGTTGLKYSAQMVDSLHKLVMATDRASSLIGTSLSGDDYVAHNKDGIWGGRTEELISVGIKINPASLKDIRDGQMSASKYQTEKIIKSSWFGMKKSESLKTTDLGDAGSIMKPINEAYKQGVETIKQAAEALGMSADEFEATAASWETTVQQLNFAGKSQAEISEMIAGAISMDLDNLAMSLTAVAPYISEYSTGMETAGETMIRLVNDMEVVTQSFTDLGLSLPPLGEGLIAVSEAVIAASGGMQNYQAAMSMFMNTFFTDAERLAFAQQHLALSFQAVGLQVPATREAMKALVISLQAEVAATAMAAKAAQAEAESKMALAQATIAASGATSQAAIVASQAAQIAAAGAAKAAAIANQAAAQLQMVMSNMAEITQVFGDASYDMPDIGAGMGSIAGSAGGCAAGINDVADAMANLADIARLESDWIGDLEGAKKVLEAVIEDTGLTGVNYDNFLEKFREASKEGMTTEELSKWQSMSSAIKDVRSEMDKLLEDQVKALEEQNKFYEGVLKKIQDAYLGSLSYLNSLEKAGYAAELAKERLGAGDTQGYFDALSKQLEYEKKMSITKEEYIPKFERYIQDLKNAEPEKDIEDAVDELEELNKKMDELKDAIEKASYQGA